MFYIPHVIRYVEQYITKIVIVLLQKFGHSWLIKLLGPFGAVMEVHSRNPNHNPNPNPNPRVNFRDSAGPVFGDLTVK